MNPMYIPKIQTGAPGVTFKLQTKLQKLQRHWHHGPNTTISQNSGGGGGGGVGLGGVAYKDRARPPPRARCFCSGTGRCEGTAPTVSIVYQLQTGLRFSLCGPVRQDRDVLLFVRTSGGGVSPVCIPQNF